MTIVHGFRAAMRFCLPALVAGLFLASGCSATRPLGAVRHDARLLMGTQVAIAAADVGEASTQAAIDAAFAEMNRLSDEMNHYDPASQVSAINRAAGVAPVAVSPDLMAVLQQARTLSDRTRGAFDITVGGLTGWRFDAESPRMPSADAVRAAIAKVNYRELILDPARGTAFLRKPGMRIDLGGIAKLYIVDAGLKMLRRHGIARAMIDAGGDIAVFGGTPERPWRVGIRDPRAPGLAGVVELTDGFVVSSGDYERFFIRNGHRYHHILDPRTGYPTAGVQHVTLIGRDAAAINGLSAAVMVLGLHAGRSLIEATPGVRAYLVADTGIWQSADFAFAAR